jgi:hypothetical protein
MVSASAGGLRYWRASRVMEGIAIATRISTGMPVHSTSISVLWLVFDGTVLRRRLKRVITHSSRPSTSRQIATISGSRIPLWNHSAKLPSGEYCGWKVIAPGVGAPLIHSGPSGV